MNKDLVSSLKKYYLQDSIPDLKDELKKLRRWFDKNETRVVAELISVLWPIYEHTEIIISNDDFPSNQKMSYTDDDYRTQYLKPIGIINNKTIRGCYFHSDSIVFLKVKWT